MPPLNRRYKPQDIYVAANRLENARWARQQRHGRRAKVIEANAKDDNRKDLRQHHFDHDENASPPHGSDNVCISAGAGNGQW